MRAKPLPPEERRAAIIAAARPLLQRNGPTVSTREVAEAAGIAEGTLFRVFDTKDALIEAVLADVMDPQASCTAIRAIATELPLEDRLGEVMRILTERIREITGFFLALRLTPKERTPEQEAEQHRTHAERTARVNDAITSVIGTDAARLRVTPAQAAGYIWSVAFVTGHPMIGSDLDLSTESAVEMMLHGMIDPAVPAARSRPTAAPPAPSTAPSTAGTRRRTSPSAQTAKAS